MDSPQNVHPEQNHQPEPDHPQKLTNHFRTIIAVVTWIELILGLSSIASAIFLNPRVPLPLYAFYGLYLALVLWLLYHTCRTTYLQSGPLNYTYWICGGCTLATLGVVLVTVFTAPNAGEIIFIAVIVFLVSLVLFPFISAVFYCFLRGNFIMPQYMRGTKDPQVPKKGHDEPDVVTNGHHDHYRTEV